MTHFLYYIIYNCSIMGIDLIYNMSECRGFIFINSIDVEGDDSELLVRSRPATIFCISFISTQRI